MRNIIYKITFFICLFNRKKKIGVYADFSNSPTDDDFDDDFAFYFYISSLKRFLISYYKDSVFSVTYKDSFLGKEVNFFCITKDEAEKK